MEKWKVVVVMLLLGVLGGYGAFQQKMTREAEEAPPANNIVDPNAPPDPNSPAVLVQKFVGKPMPAPWNIASKYWMNTKKPLEPRDLKGSVALVEFFRIKCSHCQEAAPVMESLQNKYAARGLKIVGIHSPGEDEQENDWDEVSAVCATQFGLTYPVGFDEKAQLFKTTYNGKLYPTMFLLDKKGIVVFAQTGFGKPQRAKLLAAVAREMAKK